MAFEFQSCFISFAIYVLYTESFNSGNLESSSAENQLSPREMCLVKLNDPEHSTDPKFLSLVE